MKTLSVTEFKNRPGKAFDFSDDESLLIKKYGKEAYFAFTAKTGKKLVLVAYAAGVLSRADTMNLLGIDWYGTLIDELCAAGIALPAVPPEERAEMVKRASEMLAHARNPRPPE